MALTKDEWDCFLNWLEPDHAQAGVKHELLRQRLISYFTRRGCRHAEEQADKTINRVIQKAPWRDPRYAAQVLPYCFGVARWILREYIREQARLHADPPSDTTPQPDNNSEDKEIKDRCLAHCLGKLLEPERRVFHRYYQVEGRAKFGCHEQLAEEQGITINALRIRMYRLREQLRRCIIECRARAEG